MTGGHMVVQMLHDLGAQNIFSVSGNQILPLYDAAGEYGLRIIHMRHESAAAYAAAAAAEIRNQPGIVLVSAGPAFVAALAGVAAAKSMEVPLLFLSGASATTEMGAGGFQDMDQQSIARAVCKASLEVAAIEQVQAVVSQAWELAQTGIPGPVHVSLPANVLRATASDQVVIQAHPPAPPQLASADESILQTIAQHLTQARRPLIIARPSVARGVAGKALWSIARHLHIEPIITECPRGLHDLKYREIIRHYPDSDVALVIGPADFAVGFLARSTIASQGRLFLLDAPGDPQPRHPLDIHMQMPPVLALTYLQEHITESMVVGEEWVRLWSHTPPLEMLSEQTGIHPLEVAAHVRGVLQPDDVIILDGGEFCQWMRLGLRDIPNRVIWNSRLGGIGGSIPMALGVAATGHPGRTIALLGDGAAGYHFSEWETAARYGFPLVTIIGNDARWAAEWFQQVHAYGPDRTFETALSPARYDLVANGLGATGTYVTDSATLGLALLASVSAPGPVCLNVRILSLCSPAVET
ncbi:MAG: thiamine pyrophosphate-binding protein [Ktedonobacteraceae bacterium]